MEKKMLDDIVEMYYKKYSFKQIGKELNVDRKIVSKELKKIGLNAIYCFSEKPIKTWRKYDFNENYFEIINTEHKAYWLGFVYADGYVNSQKSSFELGLQELDKGHLEKFLIDINGTMPIREKTKILKEKIYKGCCIQVNSPIFKQNLIDKGCFENKSLILDFPNEKQVPQHLIHHFIRGYIDGDGSYTLKKNIYNGINKTTISYSLSVEVLGTKEFLTGYVKNLKLHKNKLYNLRGEKSKDINSYRSIYSGPFAYQIIEYIYKDATIYLDRKYKKLCNIAALGQMSIEVLKLLERN